MNKKYIALTHFDCLQIFACHQALDMASKGLYLTRPANIRGTALYWLAKVGNPVKPKTKWAKLSEVFNETFAEVIKRDESPKTEDTPKSE